MLNQKPKLQTLSEEELKMFKVALVVQQVMLSIELTSLDHVSATDPNARIERKLLLKQMIERLKILEGAIA